jgi:hypothetical protein
MFEQVRHELPPAEGRVVEALIEEHVQVSCDLVPIDEHTWAIHGSIAVDGEVILAEFGDRADAELAVAQIAAVTIDGGAR